MIKISVRKGSFWDRVLDAMSPMNAERQRAYTEGREAAAEAIICEWGEYGLIEPWEAAKVARGDSDG